MFITTGRFSDDAEKFVGEDPSRPIVLVDGLALISTCIQLAGRVPVPAPSSNATGSSDS